MPLPLVWLNGRLLPIEEAHISPLDRGFLFGDGVYEVVPIYGGRAYRLDEHLARLERSLGEIRIQAPLDRAGMLAALGSLVHGNGGGDLLLYIQITRGVEAERNHVPQPGTRPTFFACVQPLPVVPASVIEKGATAITAEDIRWARCDVKSVSLLGNVLLRRLSADVGAAETVLHRNGFVTEGSASNVHVVKAGRIATPPQTHAILPGTTREVLYELAERARIPAGRRPVRLAELRDADEVLITSAGGGIRAVSVLDGERVGTGEPGGVFRTLYGLFRSTLAEFSTELPA